MEVIEIELAGMAYGGEAFGRDEDGRMIFVPFALPGEKVRARIIDARKRWARAHLEQVLEHTQQRVEPRCSHFGVCGGCHYQHMPYAVQIDVKSKILGEQLQRIGGFEQPPILPPIQSPSPWNTRNHLQFSLTTEGRLGFKAAASHEVIPIEECHLPLPEIADLWPRIEVEPDLGLTRIALRAGTGGERMVVLHSEREPDVDVSIDLPASTIWFGPQRMTVFSGEDAISLNVLARDFQVSARSFFQVNTPILSELVTQVMDALAVHAGQTILDLYAGVGLFSAFLAQADAHVVAVEQSPWACADFEVNLAEFDQVELYEAPVELALPALDSDVDAILCDPPRAGLSEKTRRELFQLSPLKIVYLSCDPATLARDAKYLAQAGYRLESARVIDLFPQTYHIETLAQFSPQRDRP